jgi:hypothetical protein
MKTWSLSTLRLASLLAAATLLSSPLLRAERDEDDEHAGATARVQFSDPAKPGTLKFSLPWAEVRVTGTDGNEVVVSSSLDQKGRAEVDHEGFRRLDEDVTFELLEKDNVAFISVAGDNLWAAHGAEFEIKVPRNTNLVIRTEAGGDIEVNGVEGDLDINSMNGEVVLRDVASSAVVNTMNGEISASFKSAPVKPVSLSSMNGEIEVALPSDTKANLRIRTHSGSIRTNFRDSALQTKTEKVTGRGVPAPVAPVAAPAPVAPGAPAADMADAQRELAREQARLDREQARMEARIARDAAKAAADVARSVQVHVNVDGESVSPVIVIPPIPPIPGFGGKSIVGTLNGGGVDIKLTSMNGTITVREAR